MLMVIFLIVIMINCLATKPDEVDFLDRGLAAHKVLHAVS